jgi:hypothetical protein
MRNQQEAQGFLRRLCSAAAHGLEQVRGGGAPNLSSHALYMDRLGPD